MKFVAATIVLFLGFACFQAEPSSRIVNGAPASKAQFYYQAYITVTGDKGPTTCSGTIIDRSWVVTTGTCIAGAKSATIAVGSNTITGTDSKRFITKSAKFVLHERFDPTTTQFNIGLIQTANYMYYVSSATTIGYANLPTQDVNVGQAVSVSGWGATSDNSTTTSNELEFATLQVITNSACSQTKNATLSDQVLCALPQGTKNQGVCYGDLGDPLVMNPSTKPVLVGISNILNATACQVTDPATFVRVYPFAAWIKKAAGI